MLIALTFCDGKSISVQSKSKSKLKKDDLKVCIVVGWWVVFKPNLRFTATNNLDKAKKKIVDLEEDNSELFSIQNDRKSEKHEMGIEMDQLREELMEA